MPVFLKKTIAIAVLLTTFSCIGLLFWYNEWRYALPTPIPVAYHAVAVGEHIDISNKFAVKKNKPVFLHFFNPDCPCSRFNVPHFKELAKTYGNQVNFAVVVMMKDKEYTEAEIRKKFGITVPILFDTSIARDCGVYSTPQAVLLTANQSLYYRGNYNKSRYCADKKTNYAQTAIEALLTNNQQPVFNTYALTAYGCSLPGQSCKK